MRVSKTIRDKVLEVVRKNKDISFMDVLDHMKDEMNSSASAIEKVIKEVLEWWEQSGKIIQTVNRRTKEGMYRMNESSSIAKSLVSDTLEEMGINAVPQSLNEYSRDGLPQDELQKLFSKLRKGSIIKITYKSAMSRNEKPFAVEVIKIAKKGSAEQITLKPAINPSPVMGPSRIRYYLYRENGIVSFTQADMSATLTSADILKESIKVSSMKFYTESTELTEEWTADSVKRNAEIGSSKGYGITLKPHKNPNKHKHMLMTRSTGGKIKVAFDFGKNPENVFVGTPEEVADHINKVLGLTEETLHENRRLERFINRFHQIHPNLKLNDISKDELEKLADKAMKQADGSSKSLALLRIFLKKAGATGMIESVDEKLKVSDGLGAWIKDFMKSDAPQFKSKSEKEKRDMAIAAFTDAGGKLDEAKGILSVKPNSSEWRTAKLNTDKNIEGAKGVTKLKKGDTVDIHPFDGDRYVGAVDKSNQGTYFFLAKYSVNESVQEDEFELSEGNMDKLVKQLRSAYDKIDTIDPSQPTYDKLIKLLDSLNKEQLKVLVNAKIKFISKLAFTRLNRAMSGNRNAPLPKHTRLGEQMSDKDMVDAVNKMSKDELKKLMRDKKNPMAKLAFRRFNRMQNPKDYPSDQLDENVLVKRGKKFQAGVPKWFGVVMRGLPKYPEQPVAGWKTELETGSGMPGYKSYLLHNDGLGTWTVFADADNVGNRPRMSPKGPLGSFKSPEEAMKFVEKAVLKEGKNDSEVTFELPNGGKAIDFGRWATYVHKSAEDYDKLSGSTVRLVGITKDKGKRAEIEAKLEEMGGFIKSTNSLTDEYTWDETRGAYVRTDGEEGPMEVPVLIDKGNPVADEVPFVNKYANTGEKNARKALGESSMTDDQVAERELALFITNDAQTYKQRIVPIVKNLARKMSSAGGDYDQNLAIKAFIYAVDHGMKRYKDEFGSVIKLDKAAKMNLAEYLLDYYMEDILDLMMR